MAFLWDSMMSHRLHFILSHETVIHTNVKHISHRDYMNV